MGFFSKIKEVFRKKEEIDDNKNIVISEEEK